MGFMSCSTLIIDAGPLLTFFYPTAQLRRFGRARPPPKWTLLSQVPRLWQLVACCAQQLTHNLHNKQQTFVISRWMHVAARQVHGCNDLRCERDICADGVVASMVPARVHSQEYDPSFRWNLHQQRDNVRRGRMRVQSPEHAR
jgi:hypothetical protein